MPDDHELARKLCRDCNVVGADAKARYPDRFGFWASLPLPDVDGSIAELNYAFDELKADGIVVETNYHGYYLGHRNFDPVWAELNRRHAIVFMHPTSGCILEPSSMGASLSRKSAPLSEYPNPIFEFFFDTARAIINLFYSGAIARYPNITYIISHAGGCLPPLVERFSLFGRAIPNLKVDSSVTPQYVKDKLRQSFYFDMAGTPFPDQLPMMLTLIDKSQVLYGSDYPFTSSEYVEKLAESMKQFMHSIFVNEEEQKMAYMSNAEEMFRKQQAAIRNAQ